MDRWGATDDEIAASFSGDELVPSPRHLHPRRYRERLARRDLSLDGANGRRERRHVQLQWFETNILQCELINADRIHEEWQDLKMGDKVKMCPGENWGPPAYEVALMESNQAIVIGHQENGKWGDVWQFILVPQTDGTTRLVTRSRDMKSGGIWNVIRPGEFIMERGMLLGIKERAEGMSW